MYADTTSRPSRWYDEPLGLSSPSYESTLDRLTHLVLVDGRLVDMWSEPVTGTRWQEHADRFDRERRAAVTSASAPPVHAQVLTWLDAAVGGRSQVMALDTTPLVDEGFEPDPDLPAVRRELVATAVDLLDHAARELRVPEARAALTATLRVAYETDPEGVLQIGDARRLAGGVSWVAAKANGLIGAGGTSTATGLQRAVDCRTQLALPGRAVQMLIAGYWPEPSRPTPLPDLLLLGRPEILTAATRRRLVRARDQALAAGRAVAEQGKGDVTRE